MALCPAKRCKQQFFVHIIYSLCVLLLMQLLMPCDPFDLRSYNEKKAKYQKECDEGIKVTCKTILLIIQEQ